MANEDLLLARQMPHSLEGEQAVLGSMLIDEGCIKDVMDKLRPSDFYLRQNREIFETIYTMFSYAQPIDGITVCEEMRKAGTYDEATTRSYLAQLMEITPTSANVLEYADMVLSASRRRALRSAVQDAAEKLDANAPEQDVLPDLERVLENTAERMGSNLLTPMQQVERYYAHRALIDGGENPYVRTGFDLIDRLLGGGMLYTGL